eukprot:13283116-Heterocapsa_arctica.AAC.1
MFRQFVLDAPTCTSRRRRRTAQCSSESYACSLEPKSQACSATTLITQLAAALAVRLARLALLD